MNCIIKKPIFAKSRDWLNFLVRLRGIEPPHTTPEVAALSTELQAHMYNNVSKLLIFF